ncbi:MAG TPA: hypothetical protein VGI14_03400 [Casimicrobiaceae bacterium]
MRAWLAALAAMLLPVVAGAQSGYFQGFTAKPGDVFPFPSSLTVTRSAPAGGGGVVPALYTHATTRDDTKSLEWANLTILNNHSDYGANVAVYGQANKYGRGPTWGGVMEAQDAVGTGALWGLEVDAFSTGPSRFDETGGGERIGLGVVLGRAYGRGPRATIDYAMWVMPNALSDTEADVNFGVMVSTQCRYACFAMRAGNKLAWEESARIVSKLDPDTGNWGLYNGDQPVFEVNVYTGAMRIGGRAVKVEFQ